jgi:WD40 repeat protein
MFCPVRFLLLILCAVVARADEAVSFRRDVAPLLQRRCANCHNEENAKGGYRLDTFALLGRAGDSGDAPLVAGKARESLVFKLLTTSDKDERMPQKADALPAEEISLIERWIAQGAASDADSEDQPLAELARERHLRPAPARYARAIPVTALAFHSDGRRLATSGYGEVLIWDAETGALLRRVGGLPERINGLAWHGSALAVAGGTPGQWGAVALVDTVSDFHVRILCDLPEMALAVAFHPDGTTLVAGCGDRTLRVFDTTSGKKGVIRALTGGGVAFGTQRKVLRHHADWVQSVAFSPNGKRLITASRDRTARVIGTDDWEIDATYDDHGAPLLAGAFTPDGSRGVSTARGGAAHVWNLETGNKRTDFTETGGDIRALVSSPSGLVAGGADGRLRLYQDSARMPWLELAAHRTAVESLATTRGGDVLASASADGEVVIWSPQCWEPVVRFWARP